MSRRRDFAGMMYRLATVPYTRACLSLPPARANLRASPLRLHQPLSLSTIASPRLSFLTSWSAGEELARVGHSLASKAGAGGFWLLPVLLGTGGIGAFAAVSFPVEHQRLAGQVF